MDRRENNRGWTRAIDLRGAVLLVALTACTADEAPKQPVPAASSLAKPTDTVPAADWFVDRAPEAGLQFTYRNGMVGHYYFPEMLPAGVAVFDSDNDGDLDVFLTQGRELGSASAQVPSAATRADAGDTSGRLYRNDLAIAADGSRRLRLVDVTAHSGIATSGYGMGVAAADVDNDGCVDLYLTNLGANQLFRNNCDGTFTDVSATSHTGDGGWSVSASFLDYDRDGWLDLYVGNYVRWEVASDKPCTGLTGRRDYCTPAVYQPQGDRLWHNRGDGTFADVTATALPSGPYGPALGVSTADFDGDGWIDIYVANDGRENVLWMNQRNGTFRNAGLISGTAFGGDGRPKGSMGVDAGDIDNDGDEDLFTTQLPTEGNNFYLNDGHGLFDDRSAASGLGPSSRGFTGFGTAWFDYDNDGWLDLLVANGAIEAIRERLTEPFPYGERERLYRNRGDGRFDDVSDRAGAAFQAIDVSRGAAFGDLDNDGDTDVVIANVNGPARVLINEIGQRAHWLGLRLTGTRGGRDMLGARVEIVRPGQTPSLWRRVRSDGSYASANDPRVLVGLGSAAQPVAVRVQWPDGRAEEWRDVVVDRWTTLRQGTGNAR